tara:strand:+ start:2035 stop:3015 length:981 start_codon:yes stop_codon:yes gene_type:complete
MARPKLVGTYNQRLEFPDENPFAKRFKIAAEESRNRAEEAYDKKKGEFLEDFFTNMRMTMMPPEGINMVVNDPKTGKKRLNKGFYKLYDMTPESVLADAKAKAKEAGLPATAIKMNDILNKQFNDLHTEAVKRQYEKLAVYKDQYGGQNLQELLKGEGTKFLSFYRKFSDPYADAEGGGLFKSEFSSDIARAVNNAKGEFTGQPEVNNEWVKHLKSQGYGITSKDTGNGLVPYITDIPWEWDGDNEYEVKWDQHGAYVEAGYLGFGPGKRGKKRYLPNPDAQKAHAILNQGTYAPPLSPMGGGILDTQDTQDNEFAKFLTGKDFNE